MASVCQTKVEMAPLSLPAEADCLRFPKGSMEELPTLHFSNQQESGLESGGDDPKVLDDASQAFLINHVTYIILVFHVQ